MQVFANKLNDDTKFLLEQLLAWAKNQNAIDFERTKELRKDVVLSARIHLSLVLSQLEGPENAAKAKQFVVLNTLLVSSNSFLPLQTYEMGRRSIPPSPLHAGLACRLRLARRFATAPSRRGFGAGMVRKFTVMATSGTYDHAICDQCL